MKSESKVSKKKVYSAPALEKGLDVLELLSGEPNGLRMVDITERLGRSVGELFRMMTVLEQRGYVSSAPNSDLFVLTMKMFELSHRNPPVKRLVSASGVIINKLVYQTKQSCHLVTYHEGKGHVVVQQDPPSERMFSVRLGAEAPIASTCSGHVLLAFAEDEFRSRMLKDIPRHHPKISKREASEIVKRIQGQGYERIKSIQVQGVEDIGFPIFDYTGHVVAALVMPFLSYLDGSHPVKIEQALNLISQAAAELSGKLGYIASEPA